MKIIIESGSPILLMCFDMKNFIFIGVLLMIHSIAFAGRSGGGQEHSVVLATDGGLWSAGANYSGQLGQGTSITTSPSFQNFAGGNVWTHVAVGENHNLAVDPSGNAWSWGENAYGQLGIGSSVLKTIPTKIMGLQKLDKVFAGSQHSLAIDEDRSLWAWGKNNFGQLGNGGNTNLSSPVQVIDSHVTATSNLKLYMKLEESAGNQLYMDGHHNGVAIFHGGGGNLLHQASVSGPRGKAIAFSGNAYIDTGITPSVADGDWTLGAWLKTTDPSFQVLLSIFDTAQIEMVISAGNIGLEYKADSGSRTTVTGNSITDGSWYMVNFVRESGTSNIRYYLNGQSVSTTADVASGVFTYNSDWRIGARQGGGTANYFFNGQIDDVRVYDRALSATEIAQIYQEDDRIFNKLSAGADHTLGIDQRGNLYAWGSNGFGQLGTGNSQGFTSAYPHQVGTSSHWVKVAAGAQHSLALTHNGELYAWGKNSSGQVGIGPSGNVNVPTLIGTGNHWVDIAAGTEHSIAVNLEGEIFGFGDNSQEQLGVGPYKVWTPVLVASDPGFLKVKAGAYHNLYHTTDGSVWVMGSNRSGQLSTDGTNIENVTMVLDGFAPYMIIDISGGVSASNYPISYSNTMPDLTGVGNMMYKEDKIVLKYIPAGNFMMGDSFNSEKHEVVISEGFYIGVFEVTQEQWSKVKGSFPQSQSLSGNALPVTFVSWEDIRGVSSTYNWPNQKDVGMASFMGNLHLKTGFHFDLPTEAMWEYAARAGTVTSYYYGSSANSLYHWDNTNSGGNVHDVGGKIPNQNGLFDIMGNTKEWCLDYRRGVYEPGRVEDPKGPQAGSERILRGGAYTSPPTGSADRYQEGAADRSSYNGFRIVYPIGKK